jgi:DHA1 family bicyclomycin/chloramphenicol resistance-like MFS transporter
MATASLASQVLLATPLGGLADRIGRKKVFFLLTPLSCASNLILVYAPTPEMLLISGILLGFQMIARIAVIGAMSAELVPVDCIGRWRGILGLLGGLASILAPITGGLIWENLTPAYVFLIPVVIDLLVRTPLLASIPETLVREETIL